MKILKVIWAYLWRWCVIGLVDLIIIGVYAVLMFQLSKLYEKGDIQFIALTSLGGIAIAMVVIIVSDKLWDDFKRMEE